jgi:hypothetical protein
MLINIGNSLTSVKLISLDYEYNEDTILFFKNHNLEDKFTYSFKGNQLTIIRIDKNEGWDYEHSAFIYDLISPYEYNIGSSAENIKTLGLNGYFPESCDLILDKNEYNDTFDYTFKNNNLIIKRIDKNEGWGANHKFKVVKNTKLNILCNPENFINIGSSEQNEKTIVLNKCYNDTAVIFFKIHELEDKFTYSFNENKLTIRKINKDDGWSYNHTGYIYDELSPFEYNINDSLFNKKFIRFNYLYPEDCQIILKSNGYQDAFIFNIENNNLIVVRTDKNEGWGHQHVCLVYKKNIFETTIQTDIISVTDNTIDQTIDDKNVNKKKFLSELKKLCNFDNIIIVGSSESNIKTITLNNVYSKDAILFLKSHDQEEKFIYSFNNNELTIMRIDKNEGWNYEHSGFIFDNSSPYKYTIGNSNENTKTILLNGYYPENCKLELIEQSFSDSFNFIFKNNYLSITRIDKNEGWEFEHLCNVIKDNTLEKICNVDNFINIGSSDSNIKKIKLNKIYPKNSIIFLRTHNSDEKFTYYFNEYELTIKRIDMNEGWNYNHFGFIYDNSEKYVYSIGNSEHNKKIILLNDFFPEGCKLILDENPYNDTFECNFEKNSLVITRLDKDDGWGHDHKITVFKDIILEITNNPDYFINIGSSQENIKTITLNKIHDRNTIIFFKSHNYEHKFIYFFNQNELTIKRIDKNDGWDHDHSGYIYANMEFPYEYNIGSNLDSATKIIQLPGYFPEDCCLVKKYNQFSDTFNFNFLNNNLIVSRSNKNIGWKNYYTFLVYKNNIPGIIMNPNNIININACNENETKILLNKNYEKNTIIFFKTHNYEEKFSYNFHQNQLIIKRIDKNEGWVHNHFAYIYDEPQNYEINIGSNSNSSEKKIQLYGYYPEYCSLPISIYPHSDKFHFNFHDNLLNIKRVDRNQGWCHNHTSILNKRQIPPIIFQTHYKDIPEYVKNKIKFKANGWKYLFFNDTDIINFFNHNPLPQFPNIVDKFQSIKSGPHKADLFRYYFLFINGGVFIDSDAELIKNMDDIINYHDFVTSICRDTTLYFNGLICSPPNHIIIYEALKDMYYMDVDELTKDYFKVVRNFKKIVDQFRTPKLKLYKEDGEWSGTMNMVDPENMNEIIIKHYYENKIIPM